MAEKVFTVNNIECKALHFTIGSDHRYIVHKGETDWDKFRKLFGWGCARPATGLNIDGDGEWYAVYVEDCFDPPVAIIRAETWEDVEEIFLAELDWADVDAEDFLEEGEGLQNGKVVSYESLYDNDHLVYTDRRTTADTESIMIRSAKLVQIDL